MSLLQITKVLVIFFYRKFKKRTVSVCTIMLKSLRLILSLHIHGEMLMLSSDVATLS